MRRHRIVTTFLVAIAVVVVTIGTAAADDAVPPAAPTRPDARALRDQAESIFIHEADCARALPLFEESFRLEATWMALNGMAICQEMLGRLDRAHRLYLLLLREFGAELPEVRRVRVQARVDQLARSLGGLDVTAVPAGATVRINGQDIDELPVSLMVGTYRLEVIAPGRARTVQEVRISPGLITSVAVQLPTLRAARPTPVTSRRSPWIWRSVALSGGVAGLASGGLLWLAQRDFDELDRRVAVSPQNPRRPVTDDARLVDAGERKRMAGYVLVGVGVTAVAAALTLRFWPEPPSTTPLLGVSVHERGLSFGLSWSY